ncbi:hypothetical protein H0A61_01157 [Koleobacter methoxysyntrophicus]|uniref:Uncharacterized protein n=1 Tax=Koleobacter methoxysyntrophicus TaxID=2751313 RepID=A0A8A0RLN5_9FIRM|nr:hypothetical protein [Koleobacter methoxysyntrophicus]QSQ08812.1 hypothetical protein H0A61_01157 [Koleobacter methoxysyntrophicus]
MIDLLNCLKEKVSSREISDLAGNLIKIPSYTGLENQEKEIAEFICSFFRSEGINAEMKEVLKGRPNVYATLKGQGNDLYSTSRGIRQNRRPEYGKDDSGT